MELYYSPHWMRLVLQNFIFLTLLFSSDWWWSVWPRSHSQQCHVPHHPWLLYCFRLRGCRVLRLVKTLKTSEKLTSTLKAQFSNLWIAAPRKAWNWKWRALSKWQPKSWITLNQIVICNWIKSDESILEPTPCRQDVKAKAVTKISAYSGWCRPHSKLW